MAYKDILVYLDPTAESVERLRFAVDLARTHGARLVGVDVSAATGVAEAESAEVTRQLFDNSAREAGVKAVFVPAEKPGEGDAFTHCVDLLIAPAPGGVARDLIRHSALDRALVESGAPMLILPPGWTGGKVGDGRRMPIRVTRRLLSAALDGSLHKVAFRTDPHFGLAVPQHVPGVEPHILDPIKTWRDKREFAETAGRLVQMFRENFRKFEGDTDERVRNAAPTPRIALA